MTLIVDATHLRATLTGLERITIGLFSPAALAPLPVRSVTAGGVRDMVRAQQVTLPMALARDGAAILLCPGFPPSPALLPFRHRVIPYIHDTFLATRWGDLNIRAKLYMVAPFRLMAARYPTFFANSETTRTAFQALCRSDAEIRLYRPEVGNVFGVTPIAPDRPRPAGSLRLVALGTVEPRKNYRAAARIVAALGARGVEATLVIAGRKGWGDDWAALEAAPGVTLLGYSTADGVRRAFEEADLFLSTSHEEGLGLPLLEAQHAGLPVVAPDIPVFREVLGASGILFDPARPESAADAIIALTARPDWRAAGAAAASQNLSRWNGAAVADRLAVLGFLAERIGHLARRTG